MFKINYFLPGLLCKKKLRLILVYFLLKKGRIPSYFGENKTITFHTVYDYFSCEETVIKTIVVFDHLYNCRCPQTPKFYVMIYHEIKIYKYKGMNRTGTSGWKTLLCVPCTLLM